MNPRTASPARRLTAEQLGLAPSTAKPKDEADLRKRIADLAKNVGMSPKTLNEWFDGWLKKKQAVLYGPPGTGKTYLARRMADLLTGGSAERTRRIQFHPSSSYEEFIMGLRPEVDANGHLLYRYHHGDFVTFCNAARKEPDENWVFLVDELSRADVARVLGELLLLLEYRDESHPMPDNTEFVIPSNVYLLATMNTADKSVTPLDLAMRRRFAWSRVDPDYDVLAQFYQGTPVPIAALADLLKEINKAIGDADQAIGHTFVMDQNAKKDPKAGLALAWRAEVEPQLEAIFFDQPEIRKKYAWSQVAPRLFPAKA